MADLTYEVWKMELANALDIQCGWQPGEGLIHIGHCAEGNWREAFAAGLSPEDMAYQEFACLLADEGNG